MGKRIEVGVQYMLLYVYNGACTSRIVFVHEMKGWFLNVVVIIHMYNFLGFFYISL